MSGPAPPPPSGGTRRTTAPPRPLGPPALRPFLMLAASMRPLQWLKNLFVFAPLIFAQRLTERTSLNLALLAFGAFCLLSAATYLLNDILDRERDRLHPIKRQRPIAAGDLSLGAAAAGGLLVLGGGVALAVWLGPPFLYAALVYLALQLAYSVGLKRVVILDVFTVSAGFVARVLGGAFAVGVPASSWLLVCTVLIALFLSLAKRRHELLLLGDLAEEHRGSLTQYSIRLLDQMIGVVAPATVVAYALYTLDPVTVAKFGGYELVYTVPFVLYGLFRYLYLVHRHEGGGEPDRTLLTDLPLLLNVLLYGATVILLVYVIKD